MESQEEKHSLCGFLKRSTGPLSVAWWSDALPNARRSRRNEPGRGWRPYKVVLRNDLLLFYKVPSSMVREVRGIFQIRSGMWTIPLQSEEEQLEMPEGDDTDLATDDFAELVGNSETTSDAPTSMKEEVIRTEAAARSSAWDSPSKHPELLLVRTSVFPTRWTARIERGTPAALAHELLFATQRSAETVTSALDGSRTGASTLSETSDEMTFLHMLFYSLDTSGVSWHTFLRALRDQVILLDRMQLAGGEHACIQRALLFLDLLIWKRPLVAPGHESVFFDEIEALAALLGRTDPEAYTKTMHRVRAWRESCATVDPCTPTDWLSPSTSSGQRGARRPDLDDLHTCWTVRALLTHDPWEIAQQIQVFHMDRFNAFLRVPVTAYRLSSSVVEEPLRSFRFDSIRPHWLTHVVLRQLLVDEAPERQLAAAQDTRVAVLAHWVSVACYLLYYKDVAGWAAVAAALCSRALAHVESVWRELPVQQRDLVSEQWGPKLASLGWIDGVHTEVNAQFVPDLRADVGNSSMLPTPTSGTNPADMRPIPFLGNAGILDASPPHPLQKDRYRPCANDVPLASNEREFNRVRLLAQRVSHAYPRPGGIAASHSPVVPYQCLFQRLSLHEYPQHTSTADYMGSAVAADQVVLVRFERGTIQAPRVSMPEADATRLMELPTPLPQLSLHAPPPIGVVPILDPNMVPSAPTGRPPTAFSSAGSWAQRLEREPNEIRIGRELVLRPAPRAMSPARAALALEAPTSGVRMGDMRAHPAIVYAPLAPPLGLGTPSDTVGLRRGNPEAAREVFQVEVKASTLERLVDVLVLGTHHLVVRAPATTERTVPAGELRVMQLVLDMDTFRDTFLLAFPSWCTAASLFDALLVRWRTAKSAARELAVYKRMQVPNQFPTWGASTDAAVAAEPPSFEVLSTIRTGVLAAFERWLNLYRKDWTADLTLFDALHGFVRAAGEECTASAPDPGVLAALDRIAAQLARLAPCTLGDYGVDHVGMLRAGSERTAPESEPTQPRTFDWTSQGATELLDYIESVVAPPFTLVRESDYASVAHLIEAQVAMKHSNLELERLAADDPTAAPLNMYTLLDRFSAERVCARAPPGTHMADVLPLSMREMWDIYRMVQSWLRAQVTEPRIGLERRTARLSTLVDAVRLARTRMLRAMGCSVPDRNALLAPLPASFAECAILEALTCTGSQCYRGAWEQLVRRRGVEAWKELFISPRLEETLGGACPTPDMGWVVGCLAEASLHARKSHSGDDILLDFAKCTTLWEVVRDVLRLRSSGSIASTSPLACVRLRWMREAAGKATWSMQTTLEDAALEATTSTSTGLGNRLFAQLNEERTQQQERYLWLRRMLTQPRAVAPAGAGTGGDPPVHPLPSAPPTDTAPPSDAPLALTSSPGLSPDPADALPSEPPSAANPIVQAHEALLAAVPATRVASTFQCSGALLSIWPYQKHPFVFQLTAPGGAKCTLKVPNYDEFCLWLTRLQAVSNVRLEETFDAGTYAAHVAEHMVRMRVAPLFRVSLAHLAAREGHPVPPVVERLLDEVERRGVEEQGIYRISGSKVEVDALQHALDTQPAEAVDLTRLDVHVVSSVVKLWLRELPEPLVPYAFYYELLNTEQIANHEERVRAMHALVARFPRCHFVALRRIAAHLALVAAERKKNFMAPHNIGLVFGTTLLNPPPSTGSVAEGFNNLGRAAHVVKILVVMHRHIFYDPQRRMRQPKLV